jgi:hypothetical protein
VDAAVADVAVVGCAAIAVAILVAGGATVAAGSAPESACPHAASASTNSPLVNHILRMINSLVQYSPSIT